MAIYDSRVSRRRSDVLYAVNALLVVRQKHGAKGVAEVIELAERSELQICGMCADWTLHQEGRCQPCRELLYGPPRDR